MKAHQLIAATLCAAAFACGADEITRVPDISAPVVQPGAAVVYGFVAVRGDVVRLQGVEGGSVFLTGPLAVELLELDGAFVIVRGRFTADAPPRLQTLRVESYELIDPEPEAG
jgi:hypothetical protein